MLRLIDSHCHPQAEQYDADRPQVLDRALDQAVGLIAVGTDFSSSRQAVELADNHLAVWAAVGQHPNDTKDEWAGEAFRELAGGERVVAIGETGLDYYRLPTDYQEALTEKERQWSLFKEQVELANTMGLPVIVHCREAYDHLIELLTKRMIQFNKGGVIHCFTGTVEQLEELLKFPDLYIGITGIITFDKTGRLSHAAAALPLDRLLVETDGPYLAPVPYRGQRAEPYQVTIVAEAIAKIKGLTNDELFQATTANAQRLFGLTLDD